MAASRCVTPGCLRQAFNNQQGETCCRTCRAWDGEWHGPACDARWTEPGAEAGACARMHGGGFAERLEIQNDFVSGSESLRHGSWQRYLSYLARE